MLPACPSHFNPPNKAQRFSEFRFMFKRVTQGFSRNFPPRQALDRPRSFSDVWTPQQYR